MKKHHPLTFTSLLLGSLFITACSGSGSDASSDSSALSQQENPSNKANTKYIFSADTNGYNINAGFSMASTELFITDGTAQGTVALGKSAMTEMTQGLKLENGKMLFGAYTDAQGSELWVTDGTPAGTQQVIDVYPGSTQVTSSSGAAATATRPNSGLSRAPVLINSIAVFKGRDSQGTYLYTTDGTQAGTNKVLTLSVMANSGLPAPSFSISGTNYNMAGGVRYTHQGVFFNVTTSSNSYHVAKYDPAQTTDNGLSIVRATDRLYGAYEYRNKIYLLITTNGTNRKFIDTSNNSVVTEVPTNIFSRVINFKETPLAITVNDNGLVKIRTIKSDNSVINKSLKMPNGDNVTTAGRVNIINATSEGAYAVLSKDTNSPTQLVRINIVNGEFDGSTSKVNIGNNAGSFYHFDEQGELLNTNQIVFSASNENPRNNTNSSCKGTEIWSISGLNADMLKDLNLDACSSGFSSGGAIRFGGKLNANQLLFVGYDGLNGTTGIELYVTDGTKAGTTLVKDIGPGNLSGVAIGR